MILANNVAVASSRRWAWMNKKVNKEANQIANRNDKEFYGFIHEIYFIILMYVLCLVVLHSKLKAWKAEKKVINFAMTCSYTSIKKKYFIWIQYVRHIGRNLRRKHSLSFLLLNLLICLVTMNFKCYETRAQVIKKLFFRLLCRAQFDVVLQQHNKKQWKKILHKNLEKYLVFCRCSHSEWNIEIKFIKKIPSLVQRGRVAI